MQGIYLGTVHVLPNVALQQTREMAEMDPQDYDVIMVGGGDDGACQPNDRRRTEAGPRS